MATASLPCLIRTTRTQLGDSPYILHLVFFSSTFPPQKRLTLCSPPFYKSHLREIMLATTTAMAAASHPAFSPCLSCSNTRSITPRGTSSFPCGGKMKMISEKTKKKNKRSLTVVSAVGDVSADSTTYLIAGAAAITLLGTAFPILYSRKDLCPECDGAGFVRQSTAALRANAARKDQAQIVCPRCNGLGKLNQIDK